MYKVMYQKCNHCFSRYYLSSNQKFNIYLYECANCASQISFLNREPHFILSSVKEKKIFDENYRDLDFIELKYKLFHEEKAIEKNKENKIRLQKLISNKTKVNTLNKRFRDLGIAQIKSISQRKNHLEDINHKMDMIKENLDTQIIEYKKAIKTLRLYFQKDYLNAKQNWQQGLSDLIPSSTFMKEAQIFVRNWFNEKKFDSPDLEQALCIADVWNNVLITARAGSGKTRTLVNKTIFLILHCNITPGEIMLLAFNKKAAEELNDRLKKALGDKTPHALTFHALSYSIVHPEEELIYDNLDNLRKSKEVQSVIDSFIRNKHYKSQIQQLMTQYFKNEWNHILENRYNLSPSQLIEFRKSSSSIGLDGRNYKSLGEKKIADFLFEHEIAFKYEYNYTWDDRNYKPDFTVFYPKYRDKKSLIIEYFGMEHDIEYNKQILEKIRFWERSQKYDFLALYPNQVLSDNTYEQLISEIISKHIGIPKKLSDDEIWIKIKDRAVDEFSKVCARFIDRSKQLLLDPNGIHNRFRKIFSRLTNLEKLFLPIVIDIYSEYESHLKMNNLEDFEGLLDKARREIVMNNTRWSRKESNGNLKNLKYIFIDEYQDFSLLFSKLIDSIKEQNQNILVNCVGDDWQAINTFAGSDLKYFYDFEKHYRPAKIYSILSNYRSVQSIVITSNALMNNLGKQSTVVREQGNKVKLIESDKYKPSDFERARFPGDIITPVLIRTIHSLIIDNKGVVLLSRKRTSIPYYTSKNFQATNFHQKYLQELRRYLPVEYRHLLKTFTTVHGYKGNEEDSVIIVDVMDKSFPLLHPNNIFFEFLGSSPMKVLEEERRLLYVGLTRPKTQLIIITESENKSPFLKELETAGQLENSDPTMWPFPKLDKSIYTVCISNATNKLSTIDIRAEIKGSGYEFDSMKRYWFKQIIVDNFNIEYLRKEPWFTLGKDILITIKDEQNRLIHEIPL